MSFVHVHTHTEYSLLDGANRIPDLVKRAVDLEQPAMAISDHGVMFGVMEFYWECKKKGIKPILGMEAYVAPNGMLNKSGREENETYHLLLLAKDNQGYQNLCKLHTAAALQGFYYKPRIDHALLRDHAKGLIGTSACLGSEINQFLLEGNYAEAQKRAGLYKEIFDEGSYFIELQDHQIHEQHQVLEGLLRIAKELKLPLVASNDAHYLCRESHQAHDVLLCIGTGALVEQEKRLRFNNEFYIKSEQEMQALFRDHGEAIENTMRIADMCNVELDKRRALMPEPERPSGTDSKAYLRELAERGLRERIANADGEAWERLNYELDVIGTTGFEDYFLLVREFAQFTRGEDIAFGVRGSAAGSLVSYCIGITDVDPLHYDLTFERFLNPERVSMPDIDMDFEDARRDEVIRWVTEKYGSDRVAQIVTFGTLGAKAAIKDCGRVMGWLPKDTDRICKTIPGTPGMSLDRAYKESVDFRTMVDSEPQVRELVEIAKQVEGTARHAGVHAAGVVISRDPLDEHIPLYRGNDGQPVTAFEMGVLEKIGLLKMDFLGLSNLTVLARAVELIAQSGKGRVDLKTIPLDDAKTYEMLSSGDTVGVFQLESGGMRRNIVELKPQSVKELAAMVALYRPGPMDHIPEYINFKFGRSKPTYLDDRMRPILEETYGVIVYQDQVLKLVQALAGFTLGRADILRRAMGKKDAGAMAAMQVEFVEGCAANDIPKEIADKVWELLQPFAGYAFNKAHAVCYAIVAYQTAYLKANYPVEYMAALLSVYQSREDKVTTFVEEARRQGIQVLPPDVNQSFLDFRVEGTSIRFGLLAIKGVGQGLIEAILKERDEKPFSHLYEFAERTRDAGLNKASLEALIKSGALDSVDRNRATLLKYHEAALAYADTVLKARKEGQDSLFGEGSPAEEKHNYPPLPAEGDAGRTEKLNMEKEVLGIYVSDHPLRGLESAVQRQSTHPCASVAELPNETPVTLAGVVSGLRKAYTKSGMRVMNLVIEDFSGVATGFVFGDAVNKLEDVIVKDSVISLKGRVSIREPRPGMTERTVEVRVFEASPITDAPDLIEGDEGDPALGILEINILKATRDQLEALKNLIEQHPGDYRVRLHLGEQETPEAIELLRRVEVDDRFLSRLRTTVPGARPRLRHKHATIGAFAPREALAAS